MASGVDLAKSKRWFRVYSCDRKIKKAVGACNLQELVVEAKKKMQVDIDEPVSIVLEEDGTQIEEEEYFQIGVDPKDILMLLRTNEIWTACDNYPPVESENIDMTDFGGLPPDDPDNDELVLRQLAGRLRRDLKELLLFDASECQAIVDADKNHLARLMHRTSVEVQHIQVACQRHIDELSEYREACSLLDMVKKRTKVDKQKDATSHSSASSSADSGASLADRKRKKT